MISVDLLSGLSLGVSVTPSFLAVPSSGALIVIRPTQRFVAAHDFMTLTEQSTDHVPTIPNSCIAARVLSASAGVAINEASSTICDLPIQYSHYCRSWAFAANREVNMLGHANTMFENARP
jgi:hypothetical protein